MISSLLAEDNIYSTANYLNGVNILCFIAYGIEDVWEPGIFDSVSIDVRILSCFQITFYRIEISLFTTRWKYL